MDIMYKRDKIPFKNIIFWLFFSSNFLIYLFVDKLYYVIYFIGTIFLLYNIILNIKNNKNIILYNKSIIILFVYFLVYTFLISVLHYKEVGATSIFKLFNIYCLVIFLFFKLNLYGKTYILNFYKCFVYIINAFAFINIIEIYNQKSLFYSFIRTDASQWQVIFFGTNQFRTFSIFVNAIPYGLFLVVLFWCNKFIIKNKIIYYILQANVLFNLFSTKSRSAWIAFAVTLILYCIKLIITNIAHKKFNITYKKICISIFLGIVCIVVILMFQNTIFDIYNQIFGRFITATSDSYGDGSRIQRLGTIQAVNDYMFNSGLGNFLLGNGFNTVGDFMSKTIIMVLSFKTTDNQYVKFFYEFGFIGILLYISMLIASVVKFFKSDIHDINVLSILCFWTISISMFFFESWGWSNILIFLIIIMFFICVNDENINKGKVNV